MLFILVLCFCHTGVCVEPNAQQIGVRPNAAQFGVDPIDPSSVGQN